MTAVASKPPAAKKAAAPQAPVATESFVGTVAAGLVDILQRIVDQFEACISGPYSMHAHTLSEIALEDAKRLTAIDHGDDSLVLATLYRITALAKGAHAIDLANAPTATSRHALLAQAYNLAESANISFGSVEHPCQALANGIKAGRAIGAEATSTPAAAPARPTCAQMIAFVLEKAEHNLRSILNARIGDSGWTEEDVNIDLAIDAALNMVLNLKCATPTFQEFENPWFEINAIVNLAAKSFSRDNCYYSAWLNDTDKFFSMAHELVEFANAGAGHV